MNNKMQSVTIHEGIGDDAIEMTVQVTQEELNKMEQLRQLNPDKWVGKDLELIHQEKSFLSLIKHPNIICLKDYFEDKKSMYFVTDFYSGGDLITFLEKNTKISERTTAYNK